MSEDKRIVEEVNNLIGEMGTYEEFKKGALYEISYSERLDRLKVRITRKPYAD